MKITGAKGILVMCISLGGIEASSEERIVTIRLGSKEKHDAFASMFGIQRAVNAMAACPV